MDMHQLCRHRTSSKMYVWGSHCRADLVSLHGEGPDISCRSFQMFYSFDQTEEITGGVNRKLCNWPLYPNWSSTKCFEWGGGSEQSLGAFTPVERAPGSNWAEQQQPPPVQWTEGNAAYLDQKDGRDGHRCTNESFGSGCLFLLAEVALCFQMLERLMRTNSSTFSWPEVRIFFLNCHFLTPFLDLSNMPSWKGSSPWMCTLKRGKEQSE